MTFIISSAQVHDRFASLGVSDGGTFTVSEDCLSVLEEILTKLVTEDCTLRTFRRAIGFGQNIGKSLIPLLISVRDDANIKDSTKIIDTTIKILVNLTIPIEYLLSVDALSRTDVGKHTIFELTKLLTTSKEAFMDSRSTKAVMDHIKYVVEKDSRLDTEQCDSINNCLLLIRNILHIPESISNASSCQLIYCSMQNQIIWNLFTHSIDKVIIYLMSCPQKMYWGVTMVQLIALMYKDQHVGTLQKLLNLWVQASLSESSEDNESNTSPPDQDSGESSHMITSSNPTSDSSDNGGSSGNSCDRNKSNICNKGMSSGSDCRKHSAGDIVRVIQNRSKVLAGIKRNKSLETDNSASTSGFSSMGQSIDSIDTYKSQTSGDPEQMNYQSHVSFSSSVATTKDKKRECPSSQSEVSDCGYVTQVENQESILTSSNDDDQPTQKPIHQKPHTFQKSRHKDGKHRATTIIEKKELRRKKLVKRSKSTIINMKGLLHHLPSDEDISNILKEFTVDFLLKGYGTLVQDLHSELLTNNHIQIDTSHFFWLVTYFLKFATQLELDLELVSPVLSYEIFNYLVFQGVWVYEEFEINCRIPNMDLKPCLRRLHLVVTAIREFLQAVECYQKMVHLNEEDHQCIVNLQIKISKTENLGSLFLLLLRQYNPSLQTRQYLQDLILTNHSYLMFLDNMSKICNDQPSVNIMDHLKQFASVEIMRQYGLLLENFKENGEFVNNCIFTMMHHIGGDLANVSTLFQPSILKTFSQIWETEYEICDDWSDLIEYVIHKFINTPRRNDCSKFRNSPSDIQQVLVKGFDKFSTSVEQHSQIFDKEGWTREEKENLPDYYNESRGSEDTIQNITKKYKENCMSDKTQEMIIKELSQQNIISEDEFNDYMNRSNEVKREIKSIPKEKYEDNNLVDGDIKLLKQYLFKENKGQMILWLQKVLIEACFAKLALADLGEFKNSDSIIEPIPYYFSLLNLPIPLVPWTSEQTHVLKHQPFVLLLHKLGLHLPLDTGKIFVRIPNFWNADFIFSIAQQLGPIDTVKMKFNVSLLDGMNKKTPSVVEEADASLKSGRYSMSSLKQIPSMVCYTPSTNHLSITIPQCDGIPCDLPPPELCILDNSDALMPASRLSSPVNMEFSPIHIKLDHLNDDMGHNSICDTASVASDLTRMCVSEEGDKEIVLVVDDNSES